MNVKCLSKKELFKRALGLAGPVSPMPVREPAPNPALVSLRELLQARAPRQEEASEEECSQEYEQHCKAIKDATAGWAQSIASRGRLGAKGMWIQRDETSELENSLVMSICVLDTRFQL